MAMRVQARRYGARLPKAWTEAIKSTISFVVTTALAVVRDIDVESGVHLFIRVTRSRIFNYCDLVAQFSGVAYGRLDTRVSDESDHDELMNAVPLEQ